MARVLASSIHLLGAVLSLSLAFSMIPANTTLESSHGAAVRSRWIGGVWEEGEWGGAEEVLGCVTKSQHWQACSGEEQEQGEEQV